MIARYFMFSQVYFHSTRMIYDIHLKDFLKKWLPGGMFKTEPSEFLRLSDNEVMAAITEAATDRKRAGHDPARRIVERGHFRVFYERTPEDVEIYPEAASAIYEAAKEVFGEDDVRYAPGRKSAGKVEFPLEERRRKRSSSTALFGCPP